MNWVIIDLENNRLLIRHQIIIFESVLFIELLLTSRDDTQLDMFQVKTIFIWDIRDTLVYIDKMDNVVQKHHVL